MAVYNLVIEAMQIEGFTNPSHILRTFIAREYAFSYEVGEDKEIRVAHAKGSWYFGKLKAGVPVDYFVWSDSCSGIYSENEMTKSYLEERISLWKRSCDTRDSEADLIESALHVWAGAPTSIKSFCVVQPGRNAQLDESTLDFTLFPRVEEFHK